MKEICYNQETKMYLGLSEEGELYLWEHEEEVPEKFPFNDNYKGYYSSISFSAISCCRGMFYAAGMDVQGLPQVYTSLLGSVWEPVNLQEVRAGFDGIRASGRIVCILYDKKDNQVFLACENGELVTVPDCPSCVRVMRVTDKSIVKASLVDSVICLFCEDGSIVKVPRMVAAQYNVVSEFAIDILRREGGYLVDMREHVFEAKEASCILSEQMIEEDRYRIVHADIADVPRWLDMLSEDTNIFFMCENGHKAESAVLYARKRHFYRSYSVISM